MQKTKSLSKKFLIGLAVIFAATLLIPVSIQAFAADANETETYTINNDAENRGNLVTLNNQTEFVGENFRPVVEGHHGYLYLTIDGTEKCIAAVCSSSIDPGSKQCYGLQSWNDQTTTPGSHTITPVFTTYDQDEDGYGYNYGVVKNANGDPLENVEITFVEKNTGIYHSSKTNSLGFGVSKIPFDIVGSFHIIKEGYVSDYSENFALNASDNPALFDTYTMYVGYLTTVKSNLPDVNFHVREWLGNGGRQGAGDVVEDVYMSNIPTRMLPEGAFLAVLTDEDCDRYNVNHGTLYYFYSERIGFGSRQYEISFEPDKNFDIENWVYSDGSGHSEIMEINKEYQITAANAPFTFTLNYVPPAPTETAQTGDDLGLAVIILIVIAIAGLGYVTYRVIRKK